MRRFVATPPCAEKPPQPAAGGEHAMAGHDDRERVAPERLADRLCGAALADPLGDLAVRDRLARRDRAGDRVDAAVELRNALHVEHDRREVARLALEQRDDRVDRALYVRRRRRLARVGDDAPDTPRAVARSSASGSCTAAMPRGPQAMPQRPSAVSKSVKSMPFERISGVRV